MSNVNTRVYSARVKVLSPSNLTMRVYLPKPVVEYLGLKDGDIVGFMKFEKDNEKMVIMKVLRWSTTTG